MIQGMDRIELRVRRPPRGTRELVDALREAGYDADLISEFHAADPQQVYDVIRAVVPWHDLEQEAVGAFLTAVVAWVRSAPRGRARPRKVVIYGPDHKPLKTVKGPNKVDEGRRPRT